jgi:hypothetical protein
MESFSGLTNVGDMKESKDSIVVESAVTGNTSTKAGSKRKFPHSDMSSVSNILPSSIISSLTNEAGERAGPPVEIPVSSTAKQLQLLVNSLLSNEEKVVFVPFDIS